MTFNANSSTFSGTPQLGDTGTLSIKVTATGGNGGSVSDNFEIRVGEAVLGIPSEESISIYPNPASGYFTITGISGRLIGISLISMSSREVRNYLVSRDGRYDISELGEGVFFVFAKGDEGRRQAGRLVIKRH
ncbi:MAG: putative Ig domain-containing protein [Ekhidna sp.]|nr:putative Ig domain-containing protein [Ekhidna sp.]